MFVLFRVKNTPWVLLAFLLLAILTLFLSSSVARIVLFVLLALLGFLYLYRWTLNVCGAYVPPEGVERKWCGNGAMPAGYGRLGTPYECLRAGIKVGQCSKYR